MAEQEKKIRIAFVSSYNARDRKVFSGTAYYSALALSRHCGEVDLIGPYRNNFLLTILKIISFLIRKITGKRFDHYSSVLLAKQYGAYFTRKLQDQNYDLIVACAGAAEIAYFETHIPILMYSDATFPNVIDYYPEYTNLLSASKRMGLQIEKRALEKALILLYSSEWAAQAAKNNYDVSPERVHVIPLGANIDVAPRRNEILSKRKSDTCRLLFLGINWQRKGGNIAFETLKELKKRGIKTSLTAIGTNPPADYSDQDFTLIPFLDKNTPGGRKQFDEHLLESDFLILPTRAECYGIVFAEASAYGLPSITTNTGGIPGVIQDGVNGVLLPLEAGAKEYADTIENLFLSDERYYAMVKSSRDLYEAKLNWDAWGAEVSKIITRIL